MNSLGSAAQLMLLSVLVALISHNADGKPQLTKDNIYSIINIRNAPYTIQLRDENNVLFCTGALVATKFVLTAAECFDEVDHTKTLVIAGAQTLTDEGVQRKVAEIIKHPAYESKNKFSNVAVLKLNEPFESGTLGKDNIVVTPLLDKSLNDKDPIKLVGWRKLYSKESKGDAMYHTKLFSGTQDICAKEFNITPEHNAFCALSHGYDDQFSVGDLGGPVEHDGKLAGITTSCRNCNSIDYAISFTKVYDVLSFIESAMK